MTSNVTIYILTADGQKVLQSNIHFRNLYRFIDLFLLTISRESTVIESTVKKVIIINVLK